MKIKVLTIVTVLSVLFIVGCGGKSDADLSKAASDALTADATTSGVTVEVKDGVATIKGEVADEAAKSKAETLAKVEGIKSVTNEVTVKPAPETATTDSALKGTIEEALKKKGFDKLTIDTSTTPATMRGTYPKGKLAEAIQTAQEANGGKPVKNEATEEK
ncbi:MAG: BON domain-containing protein [Pyrinomonadaceae bacterium]